MRKRRSIYELIKFLIIASYNVVFVGGFGIRRGLETDIILNNIPLLSTPIRPDCDKPVCRGPLANIFCTGDILSLSWQYGIQHACPGDKLRYPPNKVLENFEKLKKPIDKEVFTDFCAENFLITSYLEKAELKDWDANPRFIQEINNSTYKTFVSQIYLIWRSLARKFTDDVFKNPDLYPVVPVKNVFVVPGGRFQIYFYWDSYWIIKGLLISELFETAKGMIDNFAEIVKEKGFIPNSGHIQLSERTQPPLFIHMIWDYYQITKDLQSIKAWINSMDIEMEFWWRERSLKFQDRRMFHYQANTNCPRPENFLRDYQIGINSSSHNPKDTWEAIASACESGWDFSSRWLDTEGPNAYKRFTIKTQIIIPVDLNVFMALNMKYMADFHEILGDKEKSYGYRKKFNELYQNIMTLMWDEADGVWFDIDIETGKHRAKFYPSNVFPLLLGTPRKYAEKVLKYLKRNDVFRFPGGLPTTLPVPSKEQWDYPNIWAPVLHLFIKSLLSTELLEMHKLAKSEADKFVTTVHNGLTDPQNSLPSGIWEKYDATSNAGKPGFGGEYLVQIGFGWTLGTVLDLIWIFKDDGYKKISESSMNEIIRTKNFSISNNDSTANQSTFLEFHGLIVVFMLIFCVFLIFIYIVYGTYSSYTIIYSHRLLPTDEPENEGTALLESLASENDSETEGDTVRV